jgi:ribosomal protein L7/L12
MPVALAQAIEIAQRELLSRSSDGVELRVLSGKTEEFDVGWVFYYQSARYIETGNFGDSLVGSAPLFVSRSDGRPFFVSYHRPLAESISAYRACSNPNAHEVPEVRLSGWRKDAQAVTAIQAIRQHSAVGLAQAKSAVESCLANDPPVVSVSSVADARALVVALASAGFEAQVRYGG